MVDFVCSISRYIYLSSHIWILCEWLNDLFPFVHSPEKRPRHFQSPRNALIGARPELDFGIFGKLTSVEGVGINRFHGRKFWAGSALTSLDVSVVKNLWFWLSFDCLLFEICFMMIFVLLSLVMSLFRYNLYNCLAAAVLSLKNCKSSNRFSLIEEFSAWWFQMCSYVQPYLGKWSKLTNMFQMGWNHQLVMYETCERPQILPTFFRWVVQPPINPSPSPHPPTSTIDPWEGKVSMNQYESAIA